MTTEDLIRLLTQGGLFLAAIFLGVFVAPENPLLVISICLGVFCLIAVGRMGRSLWILFPLSAGFNGAINLVPGGLTPLQLVSLLLAGMCLYYLKADPQFRIKTGPAWIFWPLLFINGILIYNWIKGRDLGLNILGSRLIGGKGYLECLLPFLGFIAAISLYKPGTFHDRYLPLYVLSGYFFDALLFSLSTLLPASAPYIYRGYSSVNVEAFQALETSQVLAVSEGFILRFGRTGTLAPILLCALQLYLPYKNWLALPQILIGPVLFLFSIFLSLVSGFRNTLAKLFLVGAVGVWQSFGIFSFLFVLPGLGIVGSLIWLQGNLIRLPDPIQRTMAFLPGQWDPHIVRITKDSSKFRVDLRRIYFKEFFSASNYLGEGYLYDRNDLAYSQEQFWRRIGYTRSDDADDQIRDFIKRRQHHEGLLNVHHITGHIGTLVWILFSALVLIRCFPVLAFRTPSPLTLSSHFGATLMVLSIISFWLFYGSLRDTITEFLAFAFCFAVNRHFLYGLARPPVPEPQIQQSPPVYA